MSARGDTIIRRQGCCVLSMTILHLHLRARLKQRTFDRASNSNENQTIAPTELAYYRERTKQVERVCGTDTITLVQDPDLIKSGLFEQRLVPDNLDGHKRSFIL